MIEEAKSPSRMAGERRRQENFFAGFASWSTKIHLVLVFLILPQLSSAVYVFTQLPQTLTFTTSTPQVRLKANLGSFNTTQQYTLWGWFRFNGEATAISNILTLRNMKEVASSSSLEPYPNPKFPACPYTLQELKEKPALEMLPEVVDNPNCLPVSSKTRPSRKENDLLFINFDLRNASPAQQTYSILFLNQIDKGSDNSGGDMKIEGFADMKLVKNKWSFFAVSCDYVNGEISIFYHPFDGASQGSVKAYKIGFPEFILSQSAELVIASVENNPYFQSTSGFIGDIGMIEMGIFYTVRLDLLWMGYLPQNSYLNNGVELEFLFNGQGEHVLQASGASKDKYDVIGKSKNLALVTRDRVGWVFYPGAKVELKNFNLKTEDFVRSLCFYLQFEFEETINNEFFIVQKGAPGQAGYFSISLVKKDGTSRYMKVRARDAKSEVTWSSLATYEPKKTHRVIAGVSSNVSGQLLVVFWDSRGQTDFSEIAKAFNFDFKTDTTGKYITLFNNEEGAGSSLDGSFTFYRFIVMNSASPALFNFLLKDSLVSTMRDSAAADCKIRTSFYAQNFGCLLCENSKIANLNRTCTNVCPNGSRNGLTDVCVPCDGDKCQTSDQNFWIVTRVSNDHYQLRPSRPLLSKSFDFSSLVNIYIPNVNSTSFNYTLVPNIPEQYVDIFLKFNESMVNQTLKVDVNGAGQTQLFDANKNLIGPGTANIFIERACFLDDGLKTSMNALAITALVIFLVSFIILLIFTIVFYHRILDLASLWKFFLHNWMRLQLVASLYLLGIYMPCCAKAFLNILYKLTIGWDHAIAGPINNFNKDSAAFNEGIVGSQLPLQFIEQGAFAFILHNICIAFIIHCVILLTYLVVKIWDWFITSRARFMYIFFLFMEFTVLIVGYGVFHLQAFIFSGLNFRLAIFTHSYFIICFIIAILYLLVFAAFWIYAAVRLLGPSFYFTNPINHARFYYFFAGYRESKWARTYDLWHWSGFLVIGLVIGIVWSNAIAQLTVILTVLIALFVVSAILRPWNYLLQLILELVCQLIMIAVVIILLILAIYDASGCFTCGNREGSLCLLLVSLLFIYLMLLAIGLITQTFLLTFCQGKSFLWGKRTSSGFAFFDEQQLTGSALMAMDAGYAHSGHVESNVKYSSLENEANNYNRSDIKSVYENHPVIETSNMNYYQNDVLRQQEYKGSQINEEGYEFNRYDQSYNDVQASRTKKTMLEFMNDVRRQRENEELDTFVENGGKSEVNFIPGYKCSQLAENDFYKSGIGAHSLIKDRADEESMQERVLNSISENKIVSLHQQHVKMDQKKKSFIKQKESFYDKTHSIKSRDAGYKNSNLYINVNEDMQSDTFNTHNDNDYVRYDDDESKYSRRENNFVRKSNERLSPRYSPKSPKYIYEQNQQKGKTFERRQ